MILDFYKYGIPRHYSIFGPNKIWYTISSDNTQIGEIIFSKFNNAATLEWDGKKISIDPILKFLTITHYNIIENETITGNIQNKRHPYINLLGIKYTFKKNRLDFWDFIRHNTNHEFTLSNEIEKITYRFKEETDFNSGLINNQKFKMLSGQIECDNKNINLALIGLFQIDLIVSDFYD